MEGNCKVVKVEKGADKIKGKSAGTILNKALGTGEVDTLCRKAISGTKVKFLGVGSAHSLPKIALLVQERQHPCCFVANTQTKEKDGEHWVAFYFPASSDRSKVPFLFDSYARSPKDMGHADWADYMDTAALMRSRRGRGSPSALPDKQPLWDRQRHVVQNHESSVCGVLCAYYLWHVCRGLSPFPRPGIVSLSKLKSFVSHIKDI